MSALSRFNQTRDHSLLLIKDLNAEDCNLQSMPDVSPLKWHLAHTTWFFETFIYQSADFRFNDAPRRELSPTEYRYMFNSYYNAIGHQYPRAERALLSRPSLDEVLEYRKRTEDGVRQVVAEIKEQISGSDIVPEQTVVCSGKLYDRLTLGIEHEMQHQELMLMDIKHALSKSPLHPGLPSLNRIEQRSSQAIGTADPNSESCSFEKEVVWVGTNQNDSFSFDNERPKHEAIVPNYSLAKRLVTNREFLEFVESGGYEDPSWWLSDGWTWLKANNIDAPEYWRKQRTQKGYKVYDFQGEHKLDLDAPVSHVSYFEAQAYAAFRGARLPTEQEWEHALQTCSDQFSDAWHLWQWTNSAYLPYPGFKPFAEEAAEYNGKFMCGQFVLRGASFATPANHSRTSYRNFFYPHQRWMFSGIRLAFD